MTVLTFVFLERYVCSSHEGEPAPVKRLSRIG